MKIKYEIKEYTGKVPLGSKFYSGQWWVREKDHWKGNNGKLPSGWTPERLDDAFLKGDFEDQTKNHI